MSTTTRDNRIRLFIAPINQPTRGRWIEPDDIHDIRDEMERVREETGKEELRISDAEGLPSTLIPEHGGVPVEKISAFLDLAEQRETWAAQLYVEHYGDHLTPDEWEDDFWDRYQGVHGSAEEYAWEWLDSTHDFGDLLDHYVDADAAARDMKAGGGVSFFDVPGGVAVFVNH